MKNTDRKTRKKGPAALIFWAVIMLYFVAELVSESSGMDIGTYLRIFFWRYRPLIVPATAALVLFIVIFLLVRAVSRIKKEPVREHTHDRTDTVSYDRNETEYEHYKKQLDGFLKAGIIERDEYRLLLNRFSQNRI